MGEWVRGALSVMFSLFYRCFTLTLRAPGPNPFILAHPHLAEHNTFLRISY